MKEINNFLNLDWERESLKDSIFIDDNINEDIPEAIIEVIKSEQYELQNIFESSK